jgi:hypothetical protein
VVMGNAFDGLPINSTSKISEFEVSLSLGVLVGCRLHIYSGEI